MLQLQYPIEEASWSRSLGAAREHIYFQSFHFTIGENPADVHTFSTSWVLQLWGEVYLLCQSVSWLTETLGIWFVAVYRMQGQKFVMKDSELILRSFLMSVFAFHVCWDLVAVAEIWYHDPNFSTVAEFHRHCATAAGRILNNEFMRT